MTFPELLAEVQKLKREEQRAQTEESLEIVVSKDGLDLLNEVLTGYFGPPLKSKGHAPSRDANRRAKPYGGIRRDQTMYSRSDTVHSEYAFLWPWGNGTRITVKILQVQSIASTGKLKDFFRKIFDRK